VDGQVRAHAVEVLKRTDDEELLYYLLQLVQALRYEASNESPLASFLVQRAHANPNLAIFLHWYVLLLYCYISLPMECSAYLSHVIGPTPANEVMLA
jgi:hypothetical protein